jgi:hypothetical protein
MHNMHWSLVPGCVYALACVVQGAELSPELSILARVKARMIETLARQPNYTCVQQIERSRRRAPKRKYELHDLLRVEVAIVDGQEMYAWPGSRKFEDTDLTQMVTAGAINTGSFATHAHSVFRTPAPIFTYIGPVVLNGHDAVRFDYKVPFISSGYHIRVADKEAVVAYHGSFWADAKTDDLLRLEVVAEDIPPSLGVSAAQDSMEYARRKIGDSEFLLPAASELIMVDLSGNENRNRTIFTGCRQYTGESVLTFAEAPAETSETHAAAAAASAPKETVEIPADITFTVKLETEIDSERAAVGDRVIAVLDEDLKVKRRLLLAKRAKLLGRIVRLDRESGFAVLDLRFSEGESETARAALNAKIDESVNFTANRISFQNTMYERQRHRGAPGGMYIRSERFHLHVGDRVQLKTAALPVH